MEETWRPVVVDGIAYPGYEVSDKGNVRSFRARVGLGNNKGTASYISNTSKPLRKYVTSSGYYAASVCLLGKAKQTRIALMVLEAFVGPRPQGLHCCHGPKGALCDEATNLSWGTPSKNHGEDRLRDGSDIRGEKQGGAKLTTSQVVEIKSRLKTGRRICTALAREFGVSRSTIHAIKRGVNWFWL